MVKDALIGMTELAFLTELALTKSDDQIETLTKLDDQIGANMVSASPFWSLLVHSVATAREASLQTMTKHDRQD